jgi:Trypsin
VRLPRTLALVAAAAASLVLASPALAITNGAPDGTDGNNHPFVGELLFYLPDAEDSRFDDPGAWASCTGTLVSPTIVITAGHCTFGVGDDGASTTNGGKETTAAEGGTGGDDIWIDFHANAAADIAKLPRSSTYARDQNPLRYRQWTAVLNSDAAWHKATAHPHPLYDDNAFFVHDLGVVVLDQPVTMSAYGTVPSRNYLERYRSAPRNTHRFEVVGYGLEKVLPKVEVGGDTRLQAQPKLNNLNGNPKNTYIVLSNNTHTGGTCFGDSGGPTFDTPSSRLVVAVTSFGLSPNCTGVGGAYRLDQPDDLAVLANFGIRP